jgi:large subunit ribosomal protein L15
MANLVPVFARQAKVILSGTVDKPLSLRGLALTQGARAALLAAGGTIHE